MNQLKKGNVIITEEPGRYLVESALHPEDSGTYFLHEDLISLRDLLNEVLGKNTCFVIPKPSSKASIGYSLDKFHQFLLKKKIPYLCLVEGEVKTLGNYSFEKLWDEFCSSEFDSAPQTPKPQEEKCIHGLELSECRAVDSHSEKIEGECGHLKECYKNDKCMMCEPPKEPGKK